MQQTKLNNARIQGYGSYIPVYDIEVVEGIVSRGRPIPSPASKMALATGKGMEEFAWIYFSTEHDDRNDWDRLYHIIELTDPATVGCRFSLIPKEKLLFGYLPPTTIALPPAGLNFGKRA